MDQFSVVGLIILAVCAAIGIYYGIESVVRQERTVKLGSAPLAAPPFLCPQEAT